MAIMMLGGKILLELPRQQPPPNPSWLKISGVTKDQVGAPLAGCTVDLLRTKDDVFVCSTVSDANGNYSFDVAITDGPFYCVAYKAGAPDVAGTTINTLFGDLP